MTTALFIITISVIALHVASCAKGLKAIGTWTKPFLVPLMGLSFLWTLGAMELSMPWWPAVVFGLFFYTLGDVLLIPRDRKWTFISGMVSFTLGHAAFAWLFTRGGISGFSLMIAAIVWLAAFVFFLSPQLDWKEKDAKFKASYAVMVMLFGIIAAGSSFDGDVWARVAATAGTAVFGFSDSLILYEMRKKTDMSAIVMITYISAVALLLVAAFRMAY